jgi:hypothetical protein
MGLQVRRGSVGQSNMHEVKIIIGPLGEFVTRSAIRSSLDHLQCLNRLGHRPKDLRIARHQTTSPITTVVRNPWRQSPPVQSVVYQFDKTDYPLPGGNAAATARTAVSTLLDASAISASASGFYASVQLSVDRKLTAFEASRATNDSNFTSSMNEIEDKIQGIQDELATIADTVTERVIAGLQKPDGILAHQDTKINMLSDKLLKLLRMVEQVLGLTVTRPLSPTPPVEVSPGKKQKLDASSPMTGVCADTIEADN